LSHAWVRPPTLVVIALATCITHVINLFLRCIQHGALLIGMIPTTQLTILHLLLVLSLRKILKILRKLRELLCKTREKLENERETHIKIDGLFEIVDLFRLTILFNFDI